MGRPQKASELLQLALMMAANGHYDDLFKIEAALILQGRDEGLDQLQDPKVRRELQEMCDKASANRANGIKLTEPPSK